MATLHRFDSMSSLRRKILGIWQVQIKGVLLGSGTGVDAGTVDVALRGDHGLVAQELHQRVDADIRIGEFGGEGVAQAAWQPFVDISGYPRSVDSRSA
jgi:hypothetical protein